MISVPSLDEELNHNGTDQSIAQTFINVGVDQSLVDLSIAPSLEDSNTINEVTDQALLGELDMEVFIDQEIEDLPDAMMSQPDLELPPSPVTPEPDDDIAFIYDQNVVHSFDMIIAEED